MAKNNALLHESLVSAEYQSLMVYEHANGLSGVERSRIYALGRYEGLKAALRLLERQAQESDRGDYPRKPMPPSPSALPSFSAIFQKLRPKHGPFALGRW